MIYYLLAQNMSSSACCSAIMEMGLVNISPLPTGRALNVVTKEGAGGTLEDKGVSLPCSGGPCSPDSSRGQFLQHLASLLKGCARSQFLKLMGNPGQPAASPEPLLMASEWMLLAKHRPMSSLSHHALGNFTVSSEAWHLPVGGFPQHPRFAASALWAAPQPLPPIQSVTAIPSPVRSISQLCLATGLLGWYLSPRHSGCCSYLLFWHSFCFY